MSGYVTDLLTGLAVELQTAGIGMWKPTGVYTPLQTGIVLGVLPQAPDRIISLACYPVSDSPALSDSVLAVQVRCRWEAQDPRPVEDLADRVYNLWHSKTNLILSTGITIVQMFRQSGVSLGQDENSRWRNSSNYYLSTLRPSTNRT